MSFKTDYQKVNGLGSAKEGTSHWLSQRLTAIALIPLSLLFLYPFSQALGQDIGVMLATYQNPFHAIVAIAFLITMFRHLRLGIQVVIEDYIHSQRARAGMLIANSLTMRALAVIGVFAVAKIAFSA